MKYKDKYRIIIKFTQNDNIANSENGKGWVDYFSEILKTSINYQINAEIEIDSKNETDPIDAEDFNNTDLIIYILSPAFIVSSNINQDAAALETAFNFDIPFINNKVKKIFKAPVKIQELPLSLSTPTYYRFYDIVDNDEIDYETFEGWNEYQDNQKFWVIMADILNETFYLFDQEKSVIEKKIFISNNSSEYFNERNNIKRELKAHNVEIYPDEDFSIEANYMDDAELFFMKKCDLSLHFPDEFLSLNMDERDVTFNKLSDQKRYIWFSPLEALKPEKRIKYNELKIQLKPYKNIEAVETPIEELKTILKKRILGTSKLDDSREILENKELIYILTDIKLNEEVNSSLMSDSSLIDKYDIQILNKTENASEYRIMHYDLLKTADYFIILHLNNNPEWLKAMVSEIRKAPGFRKKNKIKGKYIFSKNLSLPNKYIEENFSLISIDQPNELTAYLKEIL